MIRRLVSGTTLVAVVIALIAALVARAWLRVRLLQVGISSNLAADMSYLVVIPVLVFLLFPLWRSEKPFLSNQFRRTDLTWGVAARALAIGLLLRLLWWSQVIAGASFGFYRSDASDVIVGPIFSFNCAPLESVVLGFFVMAFMVPIIEEVIHRGYIISALRHRGLVISVILSSLIFMIMHRYSSWPFVFFAGLVFGLQYFITQSLWPSLISHATVNGLIQLDWRCLSGHWNPVSADLPLVVPGLIAMSMLIAGLAALVFLLRQTATGARKAPR